MVASCWSLTLLDHPLLRLQKRYADDEDFQLTPAQVTQLMTQQAAELEDTDISPPAIGPSLLLTQQTTPVHPALEHQPAQNVPAPSVAAALQTSASMPAAAQGRAAEHETSPTPAAPALLQPASVPLTKPPHAAATASAAEAGRAQADADVAPAGNALPGQVRQVPHSPVHRPCQELHSAASGFAVTAASAAPSVVAAAAGAASLAANGDGGSSGNAAPSAAMSGGQSQKSGSKVWLPPAALTSPQRSSGKIATACKPETL